MLALVMAGIIPPALLVFGVAGAIVVWLAHADNIDRLLHGQERKLDFTRSQRS
jgi:glycerol-3-phosphate acyltransferase PlsY